MGMSLSYWIGPFIRVVLETTTEVKKALRCVNTECRYHKHEGRSGGLQHDWTVCPKCGTTLEEYEYATGHTIPAINYHDIEEFHEDTFSVMDTEFGDRSVLLLIPNLCAEAVAKCRAVDGKAIKRGMHFDDNDTGHVAIDDMQITREKLWFADRWAKEIGVLQKHYGADNVHQLWGWVGDMR